MLDKVTKDMNSKLREIKYQQTANQILQNLDTHANIPEHNLWKSTKYLNLKYRLDLI